MKPESQQKRFRVILSEPSGESAPAPHMLCAVIVVTNVVVRWLMFSEKKEQKKKGGGGGRGTVARASLRCSCMYNVS